jgi:hypothetical protein
LFFSLRRVLCNTGCIIFSWVSLGADLSLSLTIALSHDLTGWCAEEARRNGEKRERKEEERKLKGERGKLLSGRNREERKERKKERGRGKESERARE